LLRDLRSVRKNAGKVRDMDVLTADALTVKPDGELDCLVQLLEHLGAKRKKCARKLRRVVAAKGTRHTRRLKRNAKHVEKLLTQAESRPADSDAMSVTMARTLQLSAELQSPAQLTRKNLHEYRLKVKELRNVLQLSQQESDGEFLTMLGEVKDAIGDWHDWEELIEISGQVLDHGESCKLIKHLKAVSDSRYERALALTKDLRRKYLQGANHKQKSQHPRLRLLSPPVIAATAAIAEA
jgi:CHAD domain-containing protein